MLSHLGGLSLAGRRWIELLKATQHDFGVAAGAQRLVGADRPLEVDRAKILTFTLSTTTP